MSFSFMRLIWDGEYLLPVLLPCRPALPLRVLLLAEPLRIGSAAPFHITETRVCQCVPQLIRGSVGFEVLHLRPDAKLWCVKGQPRSAPLRHAKPAEIVLL